jgi:hypothetical protein
MNALLISIICFVLPAQPAAEASAELPLEKVLSVRGLENFNAADLRLDPLANDALLKDQKDPLALVSFNSFRFPKRKEPLRYLFAGETELTEPPNLEPLDVTKLNSLLDIHFNLGEIVLSDIQVVFGTPYFLPAAALEIEKIEESSIKQDDKSGTPELLKTEVTFKTNPIFEKFIFFSRTSLKIEDLKKALPPEFEWMKRNDLEAKLPLDPNPTEKSFEQAKEPSFNFDFSSSKLGEIGSYQSSGPSFEEYLRTPQWQTRRGFDHWGYYEGSETTFPNGGKLRVEIRRYDQPLWPNWQNRPYHRR